MRFSDQVRRTISVFSDRGGPTQVFELDMESKKTKPLVALRYKKYENIETRGRALSLSPDGLTFTPEAGLRMPNGSGMPRIVSLPAGGVRLFYTSGNGIKSATSMDGLTFTDEPGFRITAQALGFTDTTVAAMNRR